MKKIIMLLSLALAATLLLSTSALALLANHDYTVKLSTVSSGNQQLVVEELPEMTDANGKLAFRFNDVPDATMAPFLLVEIIDMASGQPEVVRQSLIPAPVAGQAMQMGVNETSHRQTRAAMRAFNGGGAEPLRAMFPLLMIATGAFSDSDVDNLGVMADVASRAFATCLTEAGVSTAQMTDFRDGLMAAMRSLAASCRLAVDEVDPFNAASRHGRADGEFMQLMIEVAADAGIAPELINAAFDQARLAMADAPEMLNLSPAGFTMFDAAFMAGQQLRQVQARMRHYADAMAIFKADAEQLQTFINARTALRDAMLVARQDYQLIFADPDNPPDQLTIDQAQADFTAAMQVALDEFILATTATDLQIETMLGHMATRMATGMMTGDSGMLSGPALMTMGFGQLPMLSGGAARNWSLMMMVAGDLPSIIPAMNYMPVTAELRLELEQLQVTPDLPVEPDWSALPDDANRSLLHLQYDLLLAALIEWQLEDNLTWPLTALDHVQIGDHHLVHRMTIRQRLQNLTVAQKDALMNAMSPMRQF